MIDEDRTLQLYWYTSKELKPKSQKKVVSVCEECGKYRVSPKAQYRPLCKACAHQTPEFRERRRECMLNMSDEHRDNLKNGWVNGKHKGGMTGKQHNEETKIRMSAAKQGIDVGEWGGFVSDGEYCHKFNASCREQNREKYNHECFICGKHEDSEKRKLSVHHVDMNKDQGCNDHTWKLVPLCHSCHSSAHNPVWQARIEYLLSSDKQ